MPKNVLFSLKICKNRQTTPVILHCKFFSVHLPTRSDSFGIDQKGLYVLVIIAVMLQAFGVKKLCCISYAKDYGNYNCRCQFFSFCPPPPLILRWRRSCHGRYGEVKKGG